MIKTGDRFNLNNENWEVIFIDNDAVVVARSENGEEGIVSQRTIYKDWYEQQKQRADELENHVKNLEMDSYLSRERADIYKNKSQRLDNNWNELKEKTIETYSTLKKEKSILAQYIGSILCVMDELEGKENVFETVQSLENNNA